MQLVVARVVATGAVASEVSPRTSLEAARQSAEDRATTVETAAAEDHVWFEDRWMVASLCDE
jgi:hypothetical protein